MSDKTMYLRQISPSFIQAGRVTSQAFRPTPKDDNMLSVYDGDKITAEDAFNHFVNLQGCKSCGVLGTECKNMELLVIPDPETFPELCLIDFSGKSNTQRVKISKKLQSIAGQRGWLYKI